MWQLQQFHKSQHGCPWRIPPEVWRIPHFFNEVQLQPVLEISIEERDATCEHEEYQMVPEMQGQWTIPNHMEHNLHPVLIVVAERLPRPLHVFPMFCWDFPWFTCKEPHSFSPNNLQFFFPFAFLFRKMKTTQKTICTFDGKSFISLYKLNDVIYSIWLLIPYSDSIVLNIKFWMRYFFTTIMHMKRNPTCLSR